MERRTSIGAAGEPLDPSRCAAKSRKPSPFKSKKTVQSAEFHGLLLLYAPALGPVA